MRANWFEWRHATLADRQACQAMIRQGSKSFFAASILLPAYLRDPAYAIYAFCRIADDAVDDENADPGATDHLRRRLDAAYNDTPMDGPCDRALADVIHRYDLPKPLFEALIEGLEWDQTGRSYQTIENLHAYAARVASAVGTIMTCLMGRKSPETLARACDLGVAMQLTNIARDVGEDARNGRVYLPRDWLNEAGISSEELIADPKMSPALGGVIKRLLDHADELYAQSRIGIAHLPSRARPAINAARRIYAAIGDEIAKNGYDSINHRAYVSTRNKLKIALAATGEAYLPCRKSRALKLDETQFLVSAVSNHAGNKDSALAEATNQIEFVIAMMGALDRRQKRRQEQAATERQAAQTSKFASLSSD
jgi:phytoene synthase